MFNFFQTFAGHSKNARHLRQRRWLVLLHLDHVVVYHSLEHLIILGWPLSQCETIPVDPRAPSLLSPPTFLPCCPPPAGNSSYLDCLTILLCGGGFVLILSLHGGRWRDLSVCQQA